MKRNVCVLERTSFLWPWFASLRFGFWFRFWGFGCVPFSSQFYFTTPRTWEETWLYFRFKIEGEMEARMKRASRGTETLVLSSRGKLVGFSPRKIRLWELRKSTIKSIS